MAASSRSTSAPIRRVFPINRHWQFQRQSTAGGGGRQSNAPSSGLKSDAPNPARIGMVTLPHANRILPWHGFDLREFQFVSLYRRRLNLPADPGRARLFADFEGVMHSAKVYCNGLAAGEHRGGYLPFSVELTGCAHWAEDNLLEVEVDSTDRPDLPPFGGPIDYLAFGGIYRPASLRMVPAMFLEDVFAAPAEVLSPARRMDVRVRVNGWSAPVRGWRLEVALEDEGVRLAAASAPLPAQPAADAWETACRLEPLPDVTLWDLDRPKQYAVAVRLFDGDELVDSLSTPVGFREARFTPEGFLLNGRPLKLRGMNRHQTYPYVGGAMPARVQRSDAEILKRELKCNVVRTSHYPQSPAFLDACDELGLMVIEEIPGWHHIGDEAWKDQAIANVEAMVRRDRNRPSVILWGVRINESADDHALYARTNAVARALDPSRPTGGIRNEFDSELLEDVFTMNDFGYPLQTPNHPLYLNTEYIGHMHPLKPQDSSDRVLAHVRRHAEVLDQLASDPRHAGGLAWCAFDYNTTPEFGAGDGVCYHGACDIFRIPKPTAHLYRSQCDPADEVVLESCFSWALGDATWPWHPDWRSMESTLAEALVASNCDTIRVYLNDAWLMDAAPDRERFPHLAHPPFRINLGGWLEGELRLDGYVGGTLAASRRMPVTAADAGWQVEADDRALLGDGIDATRVVMRVTDAEGNRRPYATGAVALSIEGPGEIIGENPFALVGGAGAVWVRSRPASGTIRLHATHPVLGEKVVEIAVTAAPEETV